MRPLIEEEANIDHIIPKAFYLASKDSDLRRVFNRRWNLQPTHPDCNVRRTFDGFPEFSCTCHRLEIDGDALYVVADDDRYRLWSPITTSSPNERMMVSVARPRPVKGSNLMRQAIVGGNAILLQGVYVGNIERFNRMARWNPTELNKHRWTQ